MKVKIQLLGGLSFNSLRALSAPGGGDDNFSRYNTLQDTWSLDDLALDLYSRNFEDDYDVLAASVQMIAASKTAKAFLNEASAAGWEAGLADLDGPDFHIDVPQKIILLNSQGVSPGALMRSAYFRHGLQVSLIRALRDIWHEKRHGGFDEKFAPDSVLLLERVRAADCDLMAVLGAWEMREEGFGDLWRHMLASNEGDIAIKFSAVYENEKSFYPVHRALEAAFKEWHKNQQRVDACDHETLEYIDAVRRDGNAIGRARAVAMDIEAISCLPNRSAYLQHAGENVLRDPLFSGLSDPLNQSHFMQVMHDIDVVFVQGVPFRDSALAAKIFPNGEMTQEKDSCDQNF